MECPSETKLQALADGSLPPDELELVLAHLDGCAACRHLVATTQSVRDEGDRIGRYLLRRVVGAGGMGVVYEAFDPELGRVVALKLLRDAAEEEARLVEEARAMARIAHPHVVAVHDIGTHDGAVYLVMDLVDGSSLRAWLSATRDTSTILRVLAEAAEGLVSVHAAGLVHRDFKPDNVLVTRDARALVSDLGLAIPHDGDAPSAGTLAYMAPEQRRGVVDARSDQFAFGVTLAEAVPSPRPRWLERVIRRTTAHEPSARYPSMNDVARALRAGMSTRRRRAIAIGTLGSLALVGVATFWLGGVRQRAAALCADSGPGAWTDDARTNIERVFESTKSPLATDAWARARAGLDAYVSELRGTRRAVCEATRVRGEQSERLLDAKIACLDQRAQTVAAEVRLLSTADAALLERVPSLLQALPSVGDCKNAMVSRSEATSSPEELPAIREGRALVAQAAVAVAAGRYGDARTVASEGATKLDATHDLDAQAEAALWLGAAQGRLGDIKSAEPTLARAAASASAAGDSLLAARAWIELVRVVGVVGKRPEEGLRYDTYAEATLRNLPEAAELRAERLSWKSALLVALHRDDDALAASREQLAIAEAQLGPRHRLYAAALDGIAGVLADRGRARDALPLQERACTALEGSLGARHPLLALCLNNLGALHGELGEHEAALPYKTRALAIFAELPGHPGQVAMAHRNLARSWLELGRVDDAAAELAKITMADPQTQLVLAEVERRRDPKRALAMLEALRGKLDTLDLHSAIAEAALYVGDLALATREAKAALDKASTPFRRILPLELTAEATNAEGARAEAEQLMASAQVDPWLVARAHWLARHCQVSAGDRAVLTARDARLGALVKRCP